MTTRITFTLIDAGATGGPDRQAGFRSLTIDGEAATIFASKLTPSVTDVTLEILADAMQAAAKVGGSLAMEVASAASAIAKEVLRGRRCLVR